MEKHLRAQEEAAGENSGLTEVSTDVISYILLRLPVKTLLQFQCVSKSWCSIIEHRSFADLVLAQLLGRFDITSLICIMDNIELSCFGRVGCRHFSLDHQTGLATPLGQLSQTVNLSMEDSQSVIGLICFEIGDLTYLCNVSTGEVKALPPTSPDFPVHLLRNIHSSVPWALILSQKHRVMETWVLNALNHSCEVITTHKIDIGNRFTRKIGSGTIEFPLGGSVCINEAIHFLMLESGA